MIAFLGKVIVASVELVCIALILALGAWAVMCIGLGVRATWERGWRRW